MEIEYIKKTIKSDPNTFAARVQNEVKELYQDDTFKEYNPQTHSVNDKVTRPDRTVKKPSGSTKTNGDPEMVDAVVKVTRMPIAFQRIIVARAAAFLTGGVVLQAATTNAAEENLLKAVRSMWDKNKLGFKSTDIAKRMMSQLECCEIWSSEIGVDNKVRMRCNVYSPYSELDKTRYTLLPIWNEARDMVAFAIKWAAKDEENKDVEFMNIYTAEELVKYRKPRGSWEITDTIQLKYGKIPVIYYFQFESEWALVQKIIERLELSFSNFSDTNDYNGSPILMIQGTIKNLADKGEPGKVFECTDGAKAEYVTWNHAPESLKLEFEKEEEWIYSMTQTPNISFDQMKGLGEISGAAFDKIMIDPQLKAKLRQDGDWGEFIQRRINFMKAAAISIDPSLAKAADLEIKPEFTIFRIDDKAERIELAMKANGNLPVITHKTSIELAGIERDPDAAALELEDKQQEGNLTD